MYDHGYYKGINLGGWFSQCDYSEERLNDFIREEDFAKIASWGFDHVRLPVDYNIIQDRDGKILEDGLQLIDRALSFCEKYGLKTVLDLHKTQGFSFDPRYNELGFFASEEYQGLFYTIWECFAERYGRRPETIMFDLLNEITEPEFLPVWIKVSTECVHRIRKYAPETPILLGSYHHNSVCAVKDLPAPYDEKVLYSFHCYEPHRYTHQGAYWEAGRRDISERIKFADSDTTEEMFEELFASAIEKAEAEGTGLYCGEYGVIDVVPPEDSLGWFRTINSVFEKHHIGRCLWSYKEMDFGLSDTRMDGVREELLKYI